MEDPCQSEVRKGTQDYIDSSEYCGCQGRNGRGRIRHTVDLPSIELSVYEPFKHKLTWPNDAIALLLSTEKPDRLKGPHHATD